MTTPHQPATPEVPAATQSPPPVQVDLEELERWLATEPKDGHELWCARCRESYSVGDNGDEPTTFCDNCAHLVCENALPILIAEVRAHRKREAEFVSARKRGRRLWLEERIIGYELQLTPVEHGCSHGGDARDNRRG